MSDSTKAIFNFKDLSYLRTALDHYVKHLAAIEEGAEGVSVDDFSDMQDDIEYLQRLRHMLDRQLAAIKNGGAKRERPIRLVSNRAEDDPA
jgi:hypothetical protein